MAEYQPSLKSRASDMQRNDAKEIVSECATYMADHPKERNALLDVGCGTGYLLMKVIAPVLGVGFKKIIGIDQTPEIVKYSKSVYGHLKGVDFKMLNIETDKLPRDFEEQFDRVTSFYVQNLVKNQRKSLDNIFKCIRKGGDCLLLFLGSNTTYDVFNTLAEDPRFKKYMADRGNVISPFHDRPNVEEEYDLLLQQVGFDYRRVEVKERTFSYEGLEAFRENMRAINVFPVPPSLREEYNEAFAECLKAMGLQQEIPESEEYKYVIKYKLIVAYARKGE